MGIKPSNTIGLEGMEILKGLLCRLACRGTQHQSTSLKAPRPSIKDIYSLTLKRVWRDRSLLGLSGHSPPHTHTAGASARSCRLLSPSARWCWWLAPSPGPREPWLGAQASGPAELAAHAAAHGMSPKHLVQASGEDGVSGPHRC